MQIDYVIVMLGTNDLKTSYKRSAEDVAQALKQYPKYVKQYCETRKRPVPKIVLVSPAYMDENATKFHESMPAPGIYDEVSAQKSREFSGPISKTAEETGCIFFDAAKVTATGEDGCHITLESHQNLADNFYKLINDL